jgi:NAD(P)-dependent dehydrogenase (short-subunit alcohol dehydrogenase family)
MAGEELDPTAVVVGVGASLGLGAALCRRFAKEGMHIFIAGRTAERIEAVANEIAEAGGTATPVVTDTTREADVVRLMETAQQDGRSLDLVVFNAGNMRLGNVVDMETAYFEETWRVTCLGGFLVGREAARRMLPRGSGSILFTGATASLRARPPFTAFASAKSALRALSFGLARELGPQGIHVGHVIVDGVILGDQVLSRMPQLRDQLGEDGMLKVDAIADAFWTLHTQDRSAWTLELDLRPYKEKF